MSEDKSQLSVDDNDDVDDADDEDDNDDDDDDYDDDADAGGKWCKLKAVSEDKSELSVPPQVVPPVTIR